VSSYLTFSPLPLGGIFSAALSVDSRLPGVTWRLAHEVRTFLWNFQRSSDQLGYILFKKIFSSTLFS